MWKTSYFKFCEWNIGNINKFTTSVPLTMSWQFISSWLRGDAGHKLWVGSFQNVIEVMSISKQNDIKILIKWQSKERSPHRVHYRKYNFEHFLVFDFFLSNSPFRMNNPNKEQARQLISSELSQHQISESPNRANSSNTFC